MNAAESASTREKIGRTCYNFLDLVGPISIAGKKLFDENTAFELPFEEIALVHEKNKLRLLEKRRGADGLPEYRGVLKTVDGGVLF